MNRGCLLIIVDLDRSPNGLREIADQIRIDVERQPTLHAARGTAAERRITGYLAADGHPDE